MQLPFECHVVPDCSSKDLQWCIAPLAPVWDQLEVEQVRHQMFLPEPGFQILPTTFTHHRHSRVKIWLGKFFVFGVRIDTDECARVSQLRGSEA